MLQRRPFGPTGFLVPPIVFGTSALGNLYEAIPMARKSRIVEAWCTTVDAPVVLDSAGKYGAGLALETLGSLLRAVGVSRDQVIISNKLGWRRAPLVGSEPTFERGVWVDIAHDAVADISYAGILRCYDEGCRLLGEPYTAQLVSVHDPDEYLAGADSTEARAERRDHILSAYEALFDLKKSGAVAAVGIGAKDWRVIQDLATDVLFDWVMFACSFTLFTHEPQLVQFLSSLAAAGVGVVNSAVFHAGFLTGGAFFDYRRADPVADAALFERRSRFHAVCADYDVRPFDACVEFGLSAPAVQAVALNTSKPERVADNVLAVQQTAPAAFWQAMKQQRIVAVDYPYLPAR